MRIVCLTADKVHWVNMQHNHKMPYPVINVPFNSWQDTSVVLGMLDGLVTVDCGTLWLSLAMKKDTAVLLCKFRGLEILLELVKSCYALPQRAIGCPV